MLEQHKITSSDALFTLWTNLFTVYFVYNIHTYIYIYIYSHLLCYLHLPHLPTLSVVDTVSSISLDTASVT